MQHAVFHLLETAAVCPKLCHCSSLIKMMRQISGGKGMGVCVRVCLYVCQNGKSNSVNWTYKENKCQTGGSGGTRWLHTACSLTFSEPLTLGKHTNIHTHKGKREEASLGVSANNRPSKPHIIALTTSSSHKQQSGSLWTIMKQHVKKPEESKRKLQEKTSSKHHISNRLLFSYPLRPLNQQVCENVYKQSREDSG